MNQGLKAWLLARRRLLTRLPKRLLWRLRDPLWNETRLWLRSNLGKDPSLFAPIEFACEFTRLTTLRWHEETSEGFDAVVVHRGELRSWNRDRLRELRDRFTPVLANARYVVFTPPGPSPYVRLEGSPALAEFSREVDALFATEGYFRALRTPVPDQATSASAARPAAKKLYCILLDNTDLPQVRGLAEAKGAVLLSSVTQCYTIASTLSMLTGAPLADLVPGGLGYNTSQRFRPDGKSVEWPFRNRLLLNRLREAGWDVRVHNCDEHAWWKPNIDAHSETHHTECRPPGTFWDEDLCYELLQANRDYAAAERAYIHSFQSERPTRNTVYFITYHEFHCAAQLDRGYSTARRAINERMNAWDWDEPGSLFWVWADHGNWRAYPNNETLHPVAWLQWAMLKDNDAKPLRPARRMVSIRDFYITMLEHFGLAPGPVDGSIPLTEALDPERIYLVEDSRIYRNTENVDTVGAIQFIGFEGGVPSLILHSAFYAPKNRTRHFVSRWSDGCASDVREVELFQSDERAMQCAGSGGAARLDMIQSRLGAALQRHWTVLRHDKPAHKS